MLYQWSPQIQRSIWLQNWFFPLIFPLVRLWYFLPFWHTITMLQWIVFLLVSAGLCWEASANGKTCLGVDIIYTNVSKETCCSARPGTMSYWSSKSYSNSTLFLHIHMDSNHPCTPCKGNPSLTSWFHFLFQKFFFYISEVPQNCSYFWVECVDCEPSPVLLLQPEIAILLHKTKFSWKNWIKPPTLFSQIQLNLGWFLSADQLGPFEHFSRVVDHFWLNHLWASFSNQKLKYLTQP